MEKSKKGDKRAPLAKILKLSALQPDREKIVLIMAIEFATMASNLFCIKAQSKYAPRLVSTVEELRSGGLLFELTDAFTHAISLPVIPNNRSHLCAVISALKSSKAVPSLTFVANQWQGPELEILEESLSINQSVKELKFQSFGFSTVFMETLVRILKKNKFIKKITFDTSPMTRVPWARFCDGLEYYNIEEICIHDSELTTDKTEVFCENILLNQTIRSITIQREWQIGEGPFTLLCNMLAIHPTIERFELFGVPNHRLNYQHLTRVIQANFLKALSLKHCYCLGVDFEGTLKALQKNTSITELCFEANTMNYAELGTVLQINKSIQKLDLSNNSIITEHHVQSLKLGDNKTLTDLDVSDCRNLSLTKLLEELEHNTTLKVLRFGNNGIVKLSALERFLRESTTLQELVIKSQHSMYTIEPYATAITSALRYNKSLRKLIVPFEDLAWADLKQFFEMLKKNTTLTYLSIGQFNKRRTIHINSIERTTDEEFIADLLTTNKTLRHVVGAENSEQLKRNRETQDKIMTDTCILIKMILMKPNSFILPIEVWSNIFKHVSYSFTPFDFESILMIQ